MTDIDEELDVLLNNYDVSIHRINASGSNINIAEYDHLNIALFNSIDTATLSSGVTLNAATSVKIADSFVKRRNFTVSNNSSQDVWIKFQAATVDNDKKGIFLFKRTVYEMPQDKMYSGEISAIADNGNPIITVVEY